MCRWSEVTSHVEISHTASPKIALLFDIASYPFSDAMIGGFRAMMDGKISIWGWQYHFKEICQCEEFFTPPSICFENYTVQQKNKIFRSSKIFEDELKVPLKYEPHVGLVIHFTSHRNELNFRVSHTWRKDHQIIDASNQRIPLRVLLHSTAISTEITRINHTGVGQLCMHTPCLFYAQKHKWNIHLLLKAVTLWESSRHNVVAT